MDGRFVVREIRKIPLTIGRRKRPVKLLGILLRTNRAKLLSMAEMAVLGIKTPMVMILIHLKVRLLACVIYRLTKA
jgi:hypothetical protein